MNGAGISVGDRVLARDRPWHVRQVRALDGGTRVVELAAADGDAPASLSVVAPPEELSPLAPEDIRLDPTGFDSYAAWLRAHRLLAATLASETGLLAGARFGRLTPEAYQLAPALRLLAKPRPRLLVADDVGLGKTIEAGLALLELMARGRARRVLIVTPAGLLLQWQEEMREKFGLDFTLIESAAGLARVQGDLPAGVSAWDVLPRVLTSIDYLKKETVRHRALRKRWDVAVVDEAHALAESGTPQDPYRTQRTRLGVALREASDGLVLLTATPHNGYAHSFRSLIELVEPAGASLHGEAAAVRRRVEHAMVRRMKSQIRRRLPDGSEERVFPRRHVHGLPVKLGGRELELLRKVGAYCARTAKAAGGTEDADLVSFAMQIVKKRALSSRRALAETVKHRLEALRREDARESPPSAADLRELQAELPVGEAAAERTARRLLRSAIPREEQRRRAEVRALRGIARLLADLPARDPKIEALRGEVRRVLAEKPDEKVIVFTEYLDTLAAVKEALEGDRALGDGIVVLRGGLGIKRRRRLQDEFEKRSTRVLLATDAASEGLNLQRDCHRVIHFELPWNPNRLEQRNGRVDRYGQRCEPEIRYLYYPESPEEDVLHRLVTKIEEIAEAYVSTPDILGVLGADGALERGLVAIDPEGADVDSETWSLVRLFEDRTEDFVRNVQPLIQTGTDVVDLLDTATPLLAEGGDLEPLVLDALGPLAMRASGEPGIYRVEVPYRLRGPGVQGIYPAVTFKREIAATRRPEDVDYMTPMHPLVQALSAEARRRLLQVYPGERGLPPRRLAARLAEGEPSSVVFTFLGTIRGGGGLLEERIISVRVGADATVLATTDTGLALLASERPGDVDLTQACAQFAPRFDEMLARVREAASSRLVERVEAVRTARAEQAAILRRDLDMDVADRIREINEDERRARGLVDQQTGQGRLSLQPHSSGGGWEARRAAVRAQEEARRGEISEFERVEHPLGPAPLGALLIVAPRG